MKTGDDVRLPEGVRIDVADIGATTGADRQTLHGPGRVLRTKVIAEHPLQPLVRRARGGSHGQLRAHRAGAEIQQTGAVGKQFLV